MIYAPDHGHVSICGKCTRASLLNPPCRDWIKCFLCQQMGHVPRHCEAKWKNVLNQGKYNHAPDYVVNKLSTTSTTIRRIWIAKDVHAGEASGSKPSILGTLIDASKDIGEGLVST
jgi:hypothetical protein